jgi:hypothetical protein
LDSNVAVTIQKAVEQGLDALPRSVAHRALHRGSAGYSIEER